MGKGSKKKTVKNPLIALIITVALIAMVFYLLENIRNAVPPEQIAVEPEQTVPEPPVKAPSRPGKKSIVQKIYSAPVITAPPQVKPLLPVTPEVKQPPPTIPQIKQPLPNFPPVKKPLPLIQPVKPAQKKSITAGTVAIIIDDMGANLEEVHQLMAIGVPLTFSIIPGMAHGREVAATAHSYRYEVLAHIPMEPKDYPARRLEQNGLLLAMSDAEIEKRTAADLMRVPYAVGANNHMGSSFTESTEKMRLVLRVLKDNGLFFIDSKTSADSVGETVSAQMGVKTASRNVFIDNKQDVAAIKIQLEELAKTARRRGSAIGIGHPHPATIKALAEALPKLQAGGIRFVFASELVR